MKTVSNGIHEISQPRYGRSYEFPEWLDDVTSQLKCRDQCISFFQVAKKNFNFGSFVKSNVSLL